MSIGSFFTLLKSLVCTGDWTVYCCGVNSCFLGVYVTFSLLMGVMKIGCLGLVFGTVGGVLSGKLVGLICTGVIGILGGVFTGILVGVNGVAGITFTGRFICGIALGK